MDEAAMKPKKGKDEEGSGSVNNARKDSEYMEGGNLPVHPLVSRFSLC